MVGAQSDRFPSSLCFMLNSLLVLLAAAAFIVFGYVSLLRIIWKQHAADGLSVRLVSVFKDPQSFLTLLGGSAIFLALPATSLLLFWGWGPALLWLMIFHLLVETIININFGADQTPITLQQALQRRGKSGPLSASIVLAWEVLIVLVVAIVLAQLASMLDQQPGLIWALLSLWPAFLIYRHAPQFMSAAVRRVLTGACIALGLVLADTLGMAIYGSWSPFGMQLDWLALNNATGAALFLMVGTALVHRNPNTAAPLATLSGYVWVMLVSLLVFFVIWNQPTLDAPLHSLRERSADLPAMININLLLFGSTLLVLWRLLAELADPAVRSSETAPAQRFAQWQGLGLFNLLLSALLVLSLGAALGIGAWKTHYLQWTQSLNLLHQFELSLTSLFELASNQHDIGHLFHTVFMAMLCIAGLRLLLTSISGLRAIVPTLPANCSAAVYLRRSGVLHAAIIFILVCYFVERGVSLNWWWLCGALAWWLLCDLLVTAAQMQADQPATAAHVIFNSLCVILIGLGGYQLIWSALAAAANDQALLALGIGAILCLSLAGWRAATAPLLRPFRELRKPKPLQ
ncbi:MAG: hypothetical protein HKN50_06855 [Gammaproteobacteria bacterium]|nr:hypothetical protein [Gammaproteobacteria bacterium]